MIAPVALDYAEVGHDAWHDAFQRARGDFDAIAEVIADAAVAGEEIRATWRTLYAERRELREAYRASMRERVAAREAASAGS